ncbi:NDMA-dependent alcohol dehydrogenase [Mycolicibacterium palauense]|uniref:NDMA-dependent alcohol dehydrogenase n=1 Tax=Mycolicibacterium palauense TaxID=2034511 RepID=UPI000BFEF949|nr:NDMA-dependent alcohol dehydrogenase [Mycolicibacterium palauense]
MKTRAAVVRQVPGKFEIVELELDEPRDGEVLVELKAAGLCHSDDHIATGDMPVPHYPIAGGHEGAGIVRQVGAGVRGVKEGDRVVFSFLPACGRCRWCARGLQNLCDLGAYALIGSRFDQDGSLRMSLDGHPVAQMAAISTFSQYTTVDERSCVKIADDIPFDVACLVGCGVATGWGSATNSAEIEVGHTVIVMGIGGIGINAVQGAKHSGALHVVAVDPVEFKRESALRLGATHAFADVAEATEFAKSVTNGQGADSAIVTVGVTKGEHVGAAFAAIRKGGTVVVTGIGDLTEVGIPVPLGELTLFQKRIQGSMYGSCSPTIDIPTQLGLYREGMLKLDELITATYKLDDVAQGYEDMHAGKNIRGVVLFD